MNKKKSICLAIEPELQKKDCCMKRTLKLSGGPGDSSCQVVMFCKIFNILKTRWRLSERS
jgi:hypothetical protein